MIGLTDHVTARLAMTLHDYQLRTPQRRLPHPKLATPDRERNRTGRSIEVAKFIDSAQRRRLTSLCVSQSSTTVTRMEHPTLGTLTSGGRSVAAPGRKNLEIEMANS
jgi:hypothetical protein